ncbi:MAG: DUF262 domain-containing protein [Thermoplasmata archaeon]|nr:DUF262 domain-containing protein [Thermoplasmata archaeon]
MPDGPATPEASEVPTPAADVGDRVIPTTNSEDVEFQAIESEEEDADLSPGEYRITSYPADFTLELLDSKLREGEIEIPPFQRQFVWKQGQASKLIESFLAGLPVPPIFLYAEPKQQKLLVIDGQQRLRTVSYFFEGYFGPEISGERRTIFRLRDLDSRSRWAGKKFSELDAGDQRKLKNTVLRSLIVQQLYPEDLTSIYHIFERLNTGGTLLKNQEIRNCVYHGALNALMLELNRDPSWRGIVGKPAPDSRQKDVELILRFFALFDELPSYDKPMIEFLNRYMRRNRDPGGDFLSSHRSLFLRTCERVVSTLGRKPFHVWAGLNSAVFDSVMIAFAQHPTAPLDDVGSRFTRLVDRREYLQAVRAHTTDVEELRTRNRIAEEILFG